LALDGLTLDALLKKVGLLWEADGTPLAGRMAGLPGADRPDLGSRLPQQVWYEADLPAQAGSQAHDQRF